MLLLRKEGLNMVKKRIKAYNKNGGARIQNHTCLTPFIHPIKNLYRILLPHARHGFTNWVQNFKSTKGCAA